MGHERIGLLPKTQRWRDLVRKIGELPTQGMDVSQVAQQSAENVRARLEHLQADGGVLAAFQFLVALSVASRFGDPSPALAVGIQFPDKPTTLALAKSLRRWVTQRMESPEYAHIAQSAAGDAMVRWLELHASCQIPLIEPADEPFEAWRKTSDGAGFCELSRLFFASLTERYLAYFLEREASAVLTSVEDRNEFGRRLRKHIDSVSEHAFETSKITQSFAAGWFNKHARQAVPNEHIIANFLRLAFGKMQEELRREACGR